MVRFHVSTTSLGLEVSVECTLGDVTINVHLGIFVALPDDAPLPLLEICGTPWTIQMVQCHQLLLAVGSGSHALCAAQQHPHLTGAHLGEQVFFLRLRLSVMDIPSPGSPCKSVTLPKGIYGYQSHFTSFGSISLALITSRGTLTFISFSVCFIIFRSPFQLNLWVTQVHLSFLLDTMTLHNHCSYTAISGVL